MAFRDVHDGPTLQLVEPVPLPRAAVGAPRRRLEASHAASDAWGCAVERLGYQAVADYLGVSRARVRNWASTDHPDNVSLATVLASPAEVAADVLETALLIVDGIVAPPGRPDGPSLGAILAVIASAVQLLPFVERPLSDLTDKALGELRELLRGLGRRVNGALAHVESEIQRRGKP